LRVRKEARKEKVQYHWYWNCDAYKH